MGTPSFLLLMAACRDDSTAPATVDPSRGVATIADMALWSDGDGAVRADPFADHAPPDAACPASGAVLEGASLEILTGTCTYGWFQQPALTDLQPGDTVEIVYWHSALVADPPAEAHVAYHVGDHLLYERVVPVPSEATAYTDTVTVDFASAPGDIVTLHLHNHGANDWNVLRVERQ